jgi:hypothetical protein
MPVSMTPTIMPSPRRPTRSGVALPLQIVSAPMNAGLRNVARYSIPSATTSTMPGSWRMRSASFAVSCAATPLRLAR